MNETKRARALDRLAYLAAQDLDLVSLWRGSDEVLSEVLPHHMAPCWFTLDPASLLATSHFQEGLLEIPGEWLAQEYAEPDFNKMRDVVRSARGVSTLDEATGGQPERSTRYVRDMLPYGANQELLVALRTRAGEAWGVLGLYRSEEHARFGREDEEFLVAASGSLAEGARKALLIADANEPEAPDAPGLVILDEAWHVLSMTEQATAWLEELPETTTGGMLPPAVYSVAGQALASAGPGQPGEVAFARVLGRSGRWIVIHGAALSSGTPERRVAVIIEPAHPARITPLLMSAYQLSEREQEVVRLVLQGLSTAEIAAALVITLNTVQQHLKSIFERTGVHSRRDLTTKVFFAHYEPRVRDNERRAIANRPLRGGPAHS